MLIERFVSKRRKNRPPNVFFPPHFFLYHDSANYIFALLFFAENSTGRNLFGSFAASVAKSPLFFPPVVCKVGKTKKPTRALPNKLVKMRGNCEIWKAPVGTERKKAFGADKTSLPFTTFSELAWIENGKFNAKLLQSQCQKLCRYRCCKLELHTFKSLPLNFSWQYKLGNNEISALILGNFCW